MGDHKNSSKTITPTTKAHNTGIIAARVQWQTVSTQLKHG